MHQLALSRGDCAAEVRTIFGLALGQQTFIYGEGVVQGEVVKPRGSGFGWDSIFCPVGSLKTMGEMTLEEKAACSMRTLALQDLRGQLEKMQVG